MFRTLAYKKARFVRVAMKTTLGKKLTLMFFIPFFVIFGALSVLFISMISQLMTNWVQNDIKAITEINATDLASRVESVRISVMSAAKILESLDYTLGDGRERADSVVRSMFANEAVYNAWLIYEPNAFDGLDADHTSDYPGAPSGRFMRSYIVEDGEILIAPDMDEEWIDDPVDAYWYVRPRDSGRFYIDLDLTDSTNIWDYGVGEDGLFTLTIVMPLFRNNEVIGCVGADLAFDSMIISIDGNHESTVAVFYSTGRVFYAPDRGFAEESIETLGFSNLETVQEAFANVESIAFTNEYCVFTGDRSFTVFQPVEIRNYDEHCLFLYVATPRSVLMDRLWPILGVIAATMTLVLAILLTLLIYVVSRVSKPINQLTLAAEAISKGDIETEIGYFSGADSEIGILSRSLHRMVEQFRVHAMSVDMTQRELSIKNRIEGLITASGNMRETLTELTAMICEAARVFKTTIVTVNAGKAVAFFSVKPHLAMTRCDDRSGQAAFDCHEQVEALIEGRKIAFLNAHTISAQNMTTCLEPHTSSAVVLPLRRGMLLGYIILENSAKITMSEGVESVMIYTADILGEWLSQQEWEGNAEPGVSDAPSVISALRGIDGLDADEALPAMGGLLGVYEESVRLTARLLPDTIDKMDRYLSEGNAKGFATEIHGLKSVLRNIGASSLGHGAARLEKAMMDGDTEVCNEQYPPFRELLTVFSQQLNAAVASMPAAEKEPAGREALSSALKAAKTAAEEFNAVLALEALSPLADFTYNEETDTLLEQVIFALEEFNCQDALSNMAKMEKSLSIGG
jgi:HAMP domain-containing protein/HPt (histidine-containing phosphotransfer) domain-containing protein